MRERVVREGRGNPLFLSELARVADRGDGALPPTLVAAVSFEVAALAHEPRALIQGAAVVGRAVRSRAGGGDRRAWIPSAAARARRAGRRRPGAPGPRARRHGRARRAAVRRDRGPRDDGALLADPHLVPPRRRRAGPSSSATRCVRRAVYDACAPGWRLGAHERAAAALEGAAPGPRPAPTTSCARRTSATRTHRGAEARRPRSPASPRPPPPRTGTGRRCGSCPTATATPAPGCSRTTRSRSAARPAAGGAHGAARGARAAPQLQLTIACARIETQLGLHTDARRRLLAARVGAPPSQHAALAFELAAGAFHEGRVAELRGWAEPAVLAARRIRCCWSARRRCRRSARCGAATRRPPPPRSTARRGPGRPRRRDARLAPRGAGLRRRSPSSCSSASRPATGTSARALAIARRTGQGQLVVTLIGLRAISLAFRLELDTALHEAEAAEEAARLQGVPHCCTSRSGSARWSMTCAGRRPRPSAPPARARR